MAKTLMKGNEAVGAAAIAAGCKHFFGYPITPQSEVPEYMARELPKIGGVYVQAESEVAAINMIYGAAGAGIRCMTSSSSPGVALMQEGISYLCGSELPCLLVNMMRGGPGLGSIQPGQADYFQATRGGGNGDYYVITYAPETIQELVSLIQEGFDVADIYRNPVMILSDGMLGQMMEPVELAKEEGRKIPEHTWAATGTGGKRKPNIINSLYIDAAPLEEHNNRLQAKYNEIREKEVKVESQGIEDAEVVFAAFGTVARIVKTAMKALEKEGIKCGIIRPITLWPFPMKEFKKIGKAKAVISVEESAGQMVEDVRIALGDKAPIYFYGRTGGVIPTPEEIVEFTKNVLGGREDAHF